MRAYLLRLGGVRCEDARKEGIVRLGVDFGTTHTVVAYADRGNYPVVSFADESGDFHESFPSVVAERDGQLRFGFEALALAREDTTKRTLVRSFKRMLSDPKVLPSTSVRVGALAVRLDELLAQFLTAVRDALLTRSNFELGKRGGAEAIAKAPCAVGVPAHAHGARRFMTLDAFRRAGFAPRALLNEPSAAGFEFTHRHRSSVTSRRDHVVVYDLGGGTFDASLVRMRGKRHDVIQTSGLSRLGGDEFDQALLELVLERCSLAEDAVPADAIARLRDECREAKERLSPSSRKLSIDVEAALGEAAPRGECVIAVNDYYDACTPLVEQTIEAMSPVLASLESALEGESAQANALAGIYVVGGASSLPLVSRLVRAQFGRRVHKSPYPSAAVAIGLAIGADETAGFELSDQFSRTFGVFREGAAGEEITFDPIFTRSAGVPLAGDGPISCTRTYRAAHNVGHFRFFECYEVSADGRPTGDGMTSGQLRFPFDPSLCEAGQDLAKVPVRRCEPGPRIEEVYTLDAHGMVAVTIRNLDANYAREFRIESAH